MDELFDDVGIKIQKFAKVAFWFWLVSAGIAFIISLFFLEEFLWFLYLLFGFIVFFVFNLIGSWLLYGFGVIVENAEFTVLNAKRAALRSATLSKMKVQADPQSTNTMNGASVNYQQPTRPAPPRQAATSSSDWFCSCGYRNSGSSKECASCYRSR